MKYQHLTTKEFFQYAVAGEIEGIHPKVAAWLEERIVTHEEVKELVDKRARERMKDFLKDITKTVKEYLA